MAAWSVCFLKTAFLSSVLGAPVELRGGSAVSSVLAARRSCGALLPFVGVRVVAEPAVENLDGEVAVDQASAVPRAGWRCSGAEWRRLPGRRGSRPSPRFWRSGGGFRRRDVLLVGDGARAQKDLCVIFFVSGLGCNTLG